MLWFVYEKLVMTQFKYITCKDYQWEKMKYGENITFEGFLEKLELIEGIPIIKMTRYRHLLSHVPLNSQKSPSPFSYVFIIKWRSRLSEYEIAEFLTKTERKTYCSMDTIHLRSIDASVDVHGLKTQNENGKTVNRRGFNFFISQDWNTAKHGSRKVIRSHRLKSRIAVEKSRQLHNDTNKNYIFKFISKWNYTHGIAFMHNLQ